MKRVAFGESFDSLLAALGTRSGLACLRLAFPCDTACTGEAKEPERSPERTSEASESKA